jgi:competence protein ComEA
MPEITVDRRSIIVAALGLFLVVALGGRFLLRGAESTPPPVRPLSAARSAPAPPARLVVHVVGAVRHPGLYRLVQGSRVADAVARAGGSTRKAQVELVNLAAPIADGEQIVVPRRGGAGGSAPVDGGGGAVSAGPVHLSTATLEQLDALPGVGPVTAQKILAYRREHGAFRSVEELDAVPGIGPARMDELRGLVAP